MAGQDTTRREVMQILAYASAASTFPGFRRWAFACRHEDPTGDKKLVSIADPPPAKIGPYKPLFFSPREYRIIERLTELIIPNDGRPGAGEAGVSEFIDFMVANSADVGMYKYQPVSYAKPVDDQARIPDALKSEGNIQVRFRLGVNWLDGHAKLHFKHDFLDCAPEQQVDILTHLAYKKHYRMGEEDGRAFFELIRRYTVMGFYTTLVGLEELDYKGLQVFWTAMPPCPHYQTDPEHLHLPPPIT
jgi:gluconate 2-dehydrogenase gamma chain